MGEEVLTEPPEEEGDDQMAGLDTDAEPVEEEDLKDAKDTDDEPDA